ncbi:emp24/gp25L/p24 family/GOLD-domain-containing protein [Blastocladiella britannica]|nr:emp24/gp25L/p24 family/GOLD-domain-containing protein [Blastocladiella britannica]
MVSSRWPALLALVCALCLAHAANALHFFLVDGKPRCFLEELPQDTVVMGVYRAEEWVTSSQAYIENLALGIQVTVEHTATGQMTVNKKAQSFGKFTFTAAQGGEHKICISTNASAWFTTSKVRLHLDLVIGEAAGIEIDPNEKVNDIVFRIRDLTHRAVDIKREQQYQREQEVAFRTLSENLKSRVVSWSLVQMVILGLTCWWQLRHLRGFFVAKKLA